MSRNANTFSVTILEKEYQVACPADQQAELLLSAKHLDEQMRAIRATGKVIGLERIAVMAALNISHELLQTRNGVDGGGGDNGDANKKAAAKGAGKGPGKTAGKRSGDGAEASEHDPASLSGLNAKLDEALHQLRQLEIG